LDLPAVYRPDSQPEVLEILAIMNIGALVSIAVVAIYLDIVRGRANCIFDHKATGTTIGGAAAENVIVDGRAGADEPEVNIISVGRVVADVAVIVGIELISMIGGDSASVNLISTE
jgi:hypothetical protein